MVSRLLVLVSVSVSKLVVSVSVSVSKVLVSLTSLHGDRRPYGANIWLTFDFLHQRLIRDLQVVDWMLIALGSEFTNMRPPTGRQRRVRY